MTAETDSTELSAEAEEAAWELATAERLRAQGDLAGAASWYRRAAEHLMDAGEDDRALEVAKTAAELMALATAPVPAPPEPFALAVTVPPAAVAPPAPVAAPVVAPPVAAPVVAPPVAAPPASASVPMAPLGGGLRRGSSKPPAPTSTAPEPVAPPPVPGPASVPAPVSPSRAPAATPPSAPSSRRPMSYLPARMAEADAVAARLPALPLFGELPAESLRGLARQATLVRFAPGETVTDGAATEGPLLVLTEGDAEARAAAEQPGVPLGAGDFAGELGAYYGGARVVTVVAQTPVEAVAFAPSLVRALARDFESFREALEEAVWEWAFAALPWAAPVLRRLDADARAAAFARFERVNLREGDVLLCEGVKPGAVWLVAAGEVEIYGGELGLSASGRALAGSALGVGAVLTEEPSGITARAVRGVLAARITAEAFRALADEEPMLAVALGDVGVTGRGVVC